MKSTVLPAALIFAGAVLAPIYSASAQVDDNAWIDAARRSADRATPAVPAPDRKPPVPKREPDPQGVPVPDRAATPAQESQEAEKRQEAQPAEEAQDEQQASEASKPDAADRAEKPLEAKPAEEAQDEQQASKPPEAPQPEPAQAEAEAQDADAAKASGAEPESAATTTPEEGEAPREVSETWSHEAAAIATLSGETSAPAAPIPQPESEPPTAAITSPEPEPARRQEPATGSGERGAKSRAPLPARKPAKPRRSSVPLSTRQAEKRPPRQDASVSDKCAALNSCRDAFAKCKADFIKKEGEWNLDKEPCGDKYKVCVRKSFAPGEMFFTRWFWPYDDCP